MSFDREAGYVDEEREAAAGVGSGLMERDSDRQAWGFGWWFSTA